MTTVNRPNKDALNKAVDIYRDAMRPFIVRCLRSLPGRRVEDLIRVALRDRSSEQFQENLRNTGSVESAIDVRDFPGLINEYWRDAFGRQFDNDKTVRNKLWLIVEGRNQVAHVGVADMELAKVITDMTHISDVLGLINRPNEKRRVEEIRDVLIQPQASAASLITDDRPTDTVETPQSPTSRSRSSSGIKPWREVIKPNADIAVGSFREAEFVADLQQVYDGRASANEYGNPVRFFDRTYLTPGMKNLLLNTLRRIGSNGGDPIIQTKVGFGGGKTHSLIALYHLISNSEAILNPARDVSSHSSGEIRRIIVEAGLNPDESIDAKIAVLDGTYLATTDPDCTESGDPLNTLWGMMAYQLGKQDAYDVIGDAARQGTAPGGRQLDRLFESVGPCVILMDEVVTYVRNTGGQQDNIYTFIQNLTQSVNRSLNAALIVTLPESDVQAGGEQGAQALARLQAIFARIESVWEPLEVHETFEVVRRRLFGNVTDEDERDHTCEAFSRMYGQSRQEYPPEAAEQNYLNRMKACYPIHPEIFERLYQDWSTNPQFQRTRGVLRMMANCVSRLYLDDNQSYMIMPGDLTFDDQSFASEFITLLGENWRAVLSEVDGIGSRTEDIDRASPQRFGGVGGAARRVARAIFLGSAPSGSLRGIDERQIRLGVVQPSQGVSVYNEARNRMVDSLYYLYATDGRYYFHAEPNLNRLANDRADQLDSVEVDLHIVEELRETIGRRSDVIVCPSNSGTVQDTDSVRLIILPPDKTLPTRSSEHDAARDAALDLLTTRGDAGRAQRNTLLFLASKSDEMRNLRSSVKRKLAWESIVSGDSRVSTLTGERQSQANSSLRSAQSDVRAALVRAYRWALSSVQDDPQNAEYRFNESMTEATSTGDIIQSAFIKFVEDEALVDRISPSALANMLERYVWNSPAYQDHVDIDTLWNLMTANVYMERLRESNRTRSECIAQRRIGGRRFRTRDRPLGRRSTPTCDSKSRAGAPVSEYRTWAASLLVNPGDGGSW